MHPVLSARQPFLLALALALSFIYAFSPSISHNCTSNTALWHALLPSWNWFECSADQCSYVPPADMHALERLTAHFWAIHL